MYKLIQVFVFSLVLSACGGGGSSSSESVSPLSAVISGMTSGLIAGDTLRLNASQSVTASAAATYSWSLTEKPAGSLAKIDNANAVDVQFIADTAGDYKVSLIVTEAGQSKSTSLVVPVAANQKPQLSLVRPDLKNLLAGQSVLLDASASRDPEMRALQFQWQVLSEPAGSQLQLPAQSQIEFVPAASGQYSIRLTLSDGVNTVTDEVAFTVYKSVLTVKADAASTATAAEQLTAFFGEGSLDLPLHHPEAEHLQLATDDVVGPHFVFSLHLHEDGDRDIPFNETDRQRAEVKSYSQSADELLCLDGDKMDIDLSLKTDDINLSTSFTHLFQLKGQADTPLFTLTAQTTNGVKALRLNHVQGTTRLSPLAAVPWEQVKNSWLAVSLRFSCGQKGYLELVVKDRQTGTVTYIDQKFQDLQMWQEQGPDVYGIKTGFYRKVKENCLPAQGDAVLLCDNPDVMKDGLDRAEDKVRIGHISIRKW